MRVIENPDRSRRLRQRAVTQTGGAYKKTLCSACYTAQQKFSPAQCHPDRPNKGSGLCAACYNNNRYHDTPADQRNLHYKKDPEKWKAVNRQWFKNNPERARELWTKQNAKPETKARQLQWSRENYDTDKNRAVLLKSKYGITPDDYDRMFESQGGVCAICGTDKPTPGEKKRFFHVDHCHETGTIRGLLCTRCNPGLGYFQDDVELLEKAIGYLKKAG